MRRLSYLILFVFMTLFNRTSAQSANPAIDSLSALLKTDLADSARCSVLAELSWETRVTNLDKAEAYSAEALKLAIKLKDEKKRATILNTQGNIRKDKGDFNKAMALYLESLRITEKIGDKKSISAGYINISNIHYYTKNFSKATEYLKKAIAIKRELKDEKGIAGCLNNIGSIYMLDQKLDSAQKYLLESLDIRIKLGNKQGISASMTNLAGLYGQMKKPELAIPYLEKALALKKEIGDSVGMVSVLINAANTFEELKEKKKARQLYNDALTIARTLDAKDDIKNALGGLATLNYSDKRFEEAYKNLEEYIRINDSTINEEVARSQAEMSAKYETEKKEKAIELLSKDKLLQEAEIQQQRTFRNLSLAVGFLVTLLAGALFFAFRQKNQSNILLQAQKSEILEKNEILTIQKEEIQVQKKEITDSINYAKRIQDSILPSQQEVLKFCKNGFILYQPKDIVSGDFYWCSNKEDVSYIVAADSTGHGVPGALMSMIGAEKLASSCKENETAGNILASLNTKLRSALKQDLGIQSTSDGMDVALLKIDRKKKKVSFSGANRPLWVVSANGDIEELKGNKFSIGGTTASGTAFEEQTIELEPGTRFYLFSDGFADQFGGNDGKKLMKKNFKAFLSSIQQHSIVDQKKELERFFETWKGHHEQVDDVMIIGLEV